jgi:hypothetical protein
VIVNLVVVAAATAVLSATASCSTVDPSFAAGNTPAFVEGNTQGSAAGKTPDLAAGKTPGLAAGDFPAFAVKEGTNVQKRFELQHELTIQKIELSGTGSDSLSQQQLELSSEIVLEVADTFQKTSPVRPLVLQRLFKSSSFHIDFAFSDASGRKIPDAWDADSPMKNKSVVFTWVPEEKGFSRYYDQVEGVEEHLSTLTEDLDLRCLLPSGGGGGGGNGESGAKDGQADAGPEKPRAVREGDVWTLELKPLASLFSPGGSIPMSYVNGGKGGLTTAILAGVGGPLSPVFAGSIKGNCTAKWTETKTTDEGKLAVIDLVLDLETEADRTEAARRYLRSEEDDDQSPVRHAGVKWKFTAYKGTLLWNLDAGRFEKLDLVGREDVTSDIQFARGVDASAQLLSMAGSLKIAASVLPAKK